MSASRNLPPTARRLRASRRQGQNGAAPELTSAIGLAFGVVGAAMFGPRLARAFIHEASALVHEVFQDGSPSPLLRVLRITTATLAPIALVAGGTALAALMQVGPHPRTWPPERRELLSLRSLSPGRQLPRLVLSLVKGLVAVRIAYQGVRAAVGVCSGPGLADGWTLVARATRALLPAMHSLLALELATGLAAAAWSQWRHRLGLRMSRQEVLREHREAEGDPLLRQAQRALHASLGRSSGVASATCVVVNPTHIAVALAHDPAADDPPWVVARGSGRAAARLRAEAVLLGIPIVRDMSLARTLFAATAVGELIPEALFEPAAHLLAQLYRMPLGGGSI